MWERQSSPNASTREIVAPQRVDNSDEPRLVTMTASLPHTLVDRQAEYSHLEQFRYHSAYLQGMS
jgi:hypothetical protein